MTVCLGSAVARRAALAFGFAACLSGVFREFCDFLPPEEFLRGRALPPAAAAAAVPFFGVVGTNNAGIVSTGKEAATRGLPFGESRPRRSSTCSRIDSISDLIMPQDAQPGIPGLELRCVAASPLLLRREPAALLHFGEAIPSSTDCGSAKRLNTPKLSAVWVGCCRFSSSLGVVAGLIMGMPSLVESGRDSLLPSRCTACFS
mmetsp:Transcript_39281/g.111213  ORF Transcript_39281/g.111213 Transcript_39281/m.111213 type:complete len:203 (-) Transcript_39281:1632-2240(-)